MRRFFVSPTQMAEDHFVITGKDAFHLHRVLRLGVGDVIIIAAQDGRTYRGRLVFVDAKRAEGKIEEEIEEKREPQTKMTLLQALPKGDKMDQIVRQGTELGLYRIIPVGTERTIVRYGEEKGRKKRSRWQKIAEEASKQAKRSLIPQVKPPKSLKEALLSDENDFDAGFVFWEKEQTCSLWQALKKAPSLGNIRLLIGPEGGLTEEEAKLSFEHGLQAVTMGPRIFRTETAALVAAAAILYESGDLGGF